MADSERPEAPEEGEPTGTESPEEVREAGSDPATGGDPAAIGEQIVRAGDFIAPEELPGGEQPVEQVAEQLGVLKYVQAAFFAAGILAAYLVGKLFLAAWNTLADWPDAVRQFPVLIEYTEDERASFTLIIGAVVGVLLVLRYYRRPSVKSWATEVAGELARVTWPSKDTVTNGTIVVIVAGVVATLYVTVLDKLWGYLTNLVYGGA